MIVLKCKMCGGNLHMEEGASTTECEYCGCMQTVPKMDDEKKLLQFERAESLRKQCGFRSHHRIKSEWHRRSGWRKLFL